MNENILIKNCDLPYFSINQDEINGFSNVMVNHCVRMHMQNSRQGTVACKGRAELVSRSNKKPWKQKGTGKARAGTARSPLWRGGGVSHGPQARTRKLKVTSRTANLVKLSLLKNLILQNKVSYINWIPDGKCASACKVLKQFNLNDKKVILFYDFDDFDTYYSFSNLRNVWLIQYSSIYPYVIAHDYNVLFLEKDSINFQSLVKSWSN